MGNNPSETILVAPEYAILEFGDGYLALIQGGIKKTNEEGIRMVELMIKPSDLLRKRFEIKDNMLNQNGVMPFKMNEDDLIPLNQFDDANRKWLYIKTFNHDETEISKIGWILRKRLEETEKRVIVLEGELIWMSEQLQLAKTNPAEFISQGAEVYEKVLRMVESFRGKKDKDDL